MRKQAGIGESSTVFTYQEVEDGFALVDTQSILSDAKMFPLTLDETSVSLSKMSITEYFNKTEDYLLPNHPEGFGTPPGGTPTNTSDIAITLDCFPPSRLPARLS